MNQLQTDILAWITKWNHELPIAVIEKKAGVPKNTLLNLKLIGRAIPEKHMNNILAVLDKEGFLQSGITPGAALEALFGLIDKSSAKMDELLAANGLTLFTMNQNWAVYEQWSAMFKEHSILSNKAANIVMRR